MKKVLYISNICVPYRTLFFDNLAKACDLTVLYERRVSANRNVNWSKVNSIDYKIEYLDGRNVHQENSFSFCILSYLKKDYNCIIIGCYNSPVEILAMLYMRLTGRKYILNIDGEIFEPINPMKKWIRNFILKGAFQYCCAGQKAIPHIMAAAKTKHVIPYFFSSLTKEEIEQANQTDVKRNDIILVIGQYEAYKGLDVLLDAAKQLPDYCFRIVGMGKKHDAFLKTVREKHIKNVETIAFMRKEELLQEYMHDKMLILPSRQECWGLVINEGAAFGIPIVSTVGSGAAIEFLSGVYDQYLAESGNAQDLATKISALYNETPENIHRYSEYLKQKCRQYSQEKIASVHIDIINNMR